MNLNKKSIQENLFKQEQLTNQQLLSRHEKRFFQNESVLKTCLDKINILEKNITTNEDSEIESKINDLQKNNNESIIRENKLNNLVEGLNKDVKSMKTSSNNNDKVVNELNSSLMTVRTTLNSLRDEKESDKNLIEEQKKSIDTLKNEIDTLKKEMESLKKK